MHKSMRLTGFWGFGVLGFWGGFGNIPVFI